MPGPTTGARWWRTVAALAATMLLLAAHARAQDPTAPTEAGPLRPLPAADSSAAARPRSSRRAAPLYRATLMYERSEFAGDVQPWSFAYAQLSRRTSLGTLVARTNYARRFARDGVQFEVDAYPKLAKGTYAYLNAGLANAPVFPNRRFGAEIYRNLPRAMEISAGVRRLDFDSSDVAIYTVSVGKYVRDYWISLRPYVTPNAGDISASGTLSVRRYLRDPEQYVTVLLSAGTQPDERFSLGGTERLRSWRAAVDGRAGALGRAGLRWSLGYERVQLPFDRQRDRLSAAVGVETGF